MNSMRVIFLIAFAAPAFANWNAGNSGSYAQAPVPANIVLSQDGRNVLDTPEVAQARAAHLAALSQAKSVAGNTNDDGSYDSRWEAESQYQPNQYNAAPAQNQWNAAPAQQWSGAPAQQWSGAPAQQWSGAPAQNQWNAAPAQPQWNSAASAKWQAQPANIALSQDGQHVLDTPEVAAARAAHLAAYSAAQATAGPSHNAPAQQWSGAPAQQWSGAPAQQWNSAPAPQWNSAPAQQWSGAPAQQWNAAPAAPAWNHAGAAPAPIADTPEVAQARAAHLAAHAAAGAHAAPAPARHW